MLHQAVQLQDGQSVGSQCQRARVGRLHVPQSVQSVPAVQYAGSSQPPSLLYMHELSGGHGKPSSSVHLVPPPPLLLLLLLLLPPAQRCCGGQLHSPAASGPIDGGGHTFGSHTEHLQAGHYTDGREGTGGV